MMQNLPWATGYNIIPLPDAASELFHSGILLSPAARVALMSISTVVIAINASLLKIK
jgi:Cu2+-exporting ATPase